MLANSNQWHHILKLYPTQTKFTNRFLIARNQKLWQPLFCITSHTRFRPSILIEASGKTSLNPQDLSLTIPSFRKGGGLRSQICQKCFSLLLSTTNKELFNSLDFFFNLFIYLYHTNTLLNTFLYIWETGPHKDFTCTSENELGFYIILNCKK